MDTRKLIYSILKEVEKGNTPRHIDYEIDLEEFGSVIEMIQKKQYIRGAKVQRAGIGNKIVYAFLDNAKLELDGLTYLEDNSAWSKGYNIAKEIRDWIK